MVRQIHVNRRQMLGACLLSIGWAGGVWSKPTAPGGPAVSMMNTHTSRLLQIREDWPQGLIEPELPQSEEDARSQSAFLNLDIHRIAGSDGIVEISVSLNSPDSRDGNVSSILMLAEKNPQALIKTFFFNADHSKKTVSTRCRLICSQRVVAVAKMRNGELRSVGRNVVF